MIRRGDEYETDFYCIYDHPIYQGYLVKGCGQLKYCDTYTVALEYFVDILMKASKKGDKSRTKLRIYKYDKAKKRYKWVTRPRAGDKYYERFARYVLQSIMYFNEF